MAEDDRPAAASPQPTDKPGHTRRLLPDSSRNLFSSLSFTWFNPIVSISRRRRLEDEDLFDISSGERSQLCTENFERMWSETNNALPKSKYALHWAILKLQRKFFLFSCIIEIISILSSVAVPKVFSYLLELVSDEKQEYPLWKALLLCSVMYLLETIRASLSNYNYWILFRAGVQIRAGMMGAMYKKSLFLAGRAREHYNIGKAVSIMSSDIMRFDTAWIYFHFFWTSPLLFLIVLGLLATSLKMAVLVSLGIVLVFFPLQAIFVYMTYIYRVKANDASDRRLKLLQEVIAGIRVIKYHAWEPVFQKRIDELRREELGYIKRMKIYSALVSTLTVSFPSLLTSISLSAFVTMYNVVNADILFASTAYFDILEGVLAVLPSATQYATECASSLQRIQGFLRAPVNYSPNQLQEKSGFAVVISDGVFEFDTEEVLPPHLEERLKKTTSLTKRSRTLSVPKAGTYDMQEGLWLPPSAPPLFTTLSISSLEIYKGELVAIVGPVGSGKTSLLNIIMGELPKSRGSVFLGGHLGLCPQQAWILNATVRDNILFGSVYDDDKYQTVIRQCALESDLASFPNGDMTLIGENGIGLSGGQKQRVNLARLVYYDPEIALLDDPMSAVDAQVATHLWRECILEGMLSTSTRLMVTHNLGLLDQVDRIIVMHNGQIVQQGTLGEILASNTPFAALLSDYFDAAQFIGDEEEDDEDWQPPLPRSPSVLSPLPLASPMPGAGDAASSEDIGDAGVSMNAYFRYFAYCGGLFFLIAAVITGIFGEGGRGLSDIWNKWWSADAKEGRPPKGNTYYIQGLILLGIGQSIFSWINCMVFVIGGFIASQVMHSRALQRLLASPIRFFDSTPSGRIINRFGKDTDVVDSNLPDELNNLFITFGLVISAVVVTSFSNPVLVLPVLVPIGIGYFIQRIYRHGSRQLQRLNILAFGPFLANFSESYAGLVSVRAFKAQDMFTTRHHSANDCVHRTIVNFAALRRWTSIRSELMGSSIMFVMGVVCSAARFGANVTGLALSQALKITKALDWCIKQFAETEISVVCSVRLDEYGSRLLTEAPAVLEDQRPPVSWPSKGVVEFRNLVVRYRHDLPAVINNLSFTTLSRERLAIVGRTGAGKSSVLNVLFRMIEPSSGQIFIDGIDISMIGLADLRSHLAIVPQDPVLFTGSLRFNLDPVSEYSDAEIWQCLERVHLKDVVSHRPSQLLMPVDDGGSNFSVGQRQLFCLARALLRRTCVLLMDEATANIDHQTDALVQESLRENFKSHTIITIAHRINTIIDYDRVLVLKNGSIVEFDSPQVLLANPDSLFAKMAAQHS
jgi:ATP-binding cassette subfamily C (CFTR/MRP) protein 1